MLIKKSCIVVAYLIFMNYAKANSFVKEFVRVNDVVAQKNIMRSANEYLSNKSDGNTLHFNVSNYLAYKYPTFHSRMRISKVQIIKEIFGEEKYNELVDFCEDVLKSERHNDKTIGASIVLTKVLFSHFHNEQLWQRVAVVPTFFSAHYFKLLTCLSVANDELAKNLCLTHLFYSESITSEQSGLNTKKGRNFLDRVPANTHEILESLTYNKKQQLELVTAGLNAEDIFDRYASSNDSRVLIQVLRFYNSDPKFHAKFINLVKNIMQRKEIENTLFNPSSRMKRLYDELELAVISKLEEFKKDSIVVDFYKKQFQHTIKNRLNGKNACSTDVLWILNCLDQYEYVHSELNKVDYELTLKNYYNRFMIKFYPHPKEVGVPADRKKLQSFR